METDLTDREAVNEAVAVGLGHPREQGALRQMQQQWPPDYLSDDPRLGDDPRLNREMRDRLLAVEGWLEVSFEIGGCTVSGPWTGGSVASSHGATEAEALVRALDAAGVVTLPGKEKADG